MSSNVRPNTLSFFGWDVVPNDAIPARTDVVVVGVPADRYSPVGGASEAPDRMRALPFYDQHSDFRLDKVKGVDIGNVDQFATDLPVAIREAIAHVPPNALLIVVGGDDAISLPVVTSRGKQLIHFDAHSDMWEKPTLQNGSWVRGVQMPVLQQGVRVGPSRRTDAMEANTPTTLVVDIDVVDPAFAPGVSYPVPGGWFAHKLLEAVQMAVTNQDVRTVVVTEVNPSRDHNDMTSWLAQFVMVVAMDAFIAKKPAKKTPAKRTSKR